MKAVYIQSHGGPEVLTYGDLPDPHPGPGEITVRVRACSLNRLDIFTRTGARGQKRDFREPLVLGCDIAGEVAEVGEGVWAVKPGDRVVLDPVVTCGQCPACLSGRDDMCDQREMLGSTRNGGYAEYVRAPAVNAFPIPSGMGYEEAAAIPTTFMPVWRMLVRQGDLKPWETVLVLSASSGVGVAAIQVAKHVIGARVIATTSTPEKAQRAREVGADEVILYTQEDITRRALDLTGGRGVDMVVDHVGAEFWERAFNALAKGGRYGICGVTTGYQVTLHMGNLFTKHLTVFGVRMASKEDLREVLEALARRGVRPVIHRVFPLPEAQEAHRLMESRSFFGKILLRVP